MDGNALGNELSKAGKTGSSTFSKSFSSGMSARAVAIGNIMSSALIKGVETASSLASKLFSDAFTNYSTFEQLSGGVQKIFDDMDTSRVFQDANNAWLDLNMSANEYMATINDVGAMFSATMGDEAAYDTARRGMKAISDYSSGTGKNLDLLNEKFAMITRSTSSYQSIADQFSGILPATSKDFLEQAKAAGYLSESYEKLTDVPIDEYQKALVAMLEKGTEELGLQGNTAEETAHTISGSIAGMKSAWQNWLTGLAMDNADMDKLTDDLVTSVGWVIDNALPRIQQIMERMGPALAEAISGVLHDISPEMGDTFDKFAEAAGKVADGLANIISQAAASGVLDAIADAIINIGDAIANIDLGPFFDTLADLLGKLNEAATFLKNWNIEAAMENGGMYAEVTDPTSWHLFDENAKSFQRDLEALGASIYDYGELSDATMRKVADAYRTNGNDMEAALASAGLEVDKTTGKIEKMNSVKLEEKLAKVELEDGQLLDSQGHVYTWNGTELLDKDGNVAVDEVELIDAQGNVKTWNGMTLEPKKTYVSVDTSSINTAKTVWSLWQPATKYVDLVAKVSTGNASGGFFSLHAGGGFITDGTVSLGRDRLGIEHIAGEAGREWVMRHADGTTSIVPIENRKYLEPYASAIASMIDGVGTRNPTYNITVNASGDGDDIARQVTKAIRAQELMRGRR
jgi:hypothetical protein